MIINDHGGGAASDITVGIFGAAMRPSKRSIAALALFSALAPRGISSAKVTNTYSRSVDST